MSYYYSTGWRKLRLEILARDRWKCCECHQELKGRSAHVHHKLPRALGGKDASENLISLCARCHSTKHANLHAGLATSFLQSAAVKLAKLFAPQELKNFDGAKLGIALRYLGIKRLRPNQLEPIVAALSGKNILLISPTGSGKSLCFQIPALIAHSHSLVFSPLKALMSDQVVGLLKRDYPATFLNSDVSSKEIEKRLKLLKAGVFKLLYLAPERFVRTKKRQAEFETIQSCQPSYLIVDEAHCIDKWGDSFRPAYSQIGAYRKQLGSPPVLAFTATANKATRNEILASLAANDAQIFVEDLDRPNVALARIQMHSDLSRAKLIRELHSKMQDSCSGKTLIFVPTRRVGQEVQELLSSEAITTEFFHGRLKAMERERIIQQFSKLDGGPARKEINCLICTNAFGMGMDIPNIRLVFHWHQPASVEDYAQEFGRAGRDGRQSLAILFTRHNDEKLLNFMAEKSIEASGLPPTQRDAALAKRQTSIARMKLYAQKQKQCFNQLLLQELGSTPKPIPGLSKFLLDLAFSQRKKQPPRKACCDGCWRKRHNGPISKFTHDVVGMMKQ